MPEEILYTDLNAIMLLYKNGDLPNDKLAFAYKKAPGSIQWVHRDELKKLVALEAAYPQANTQKHADIKKPKDPAQVV